MNATALRVPTTVAIPAGAFLMGAVPDDKFANATELPRHEVVIPDSFEMSRCPITNEEWDAVMGNCNAFQSALANLPKVHISWNEAIRFCEALSQGTGDLWQLPTEAEWEYACRAGSQDTIFSTGSIISPDQASFYYGEQAERLGSRHLEPVGSFPPNAFGLCDMHGSVCEWTADVWRKDYLPGTAPDPARRAVRGGAWDYMPRLLRSSWRDGLPISSQRDNLGFRVVRKLR